MKQKKLSAYLGGTTGILIVLGIVIAVNVVFSAIRIRKDMTEDKIYTLSSGTITLLEELDRNVTLKFYFTGSNERVPIPLKQYAQRVRDLLHEYETHSGGRLLVETYDPRPDSDAQEWAERYGLSAQSLGSVGMQPDFYMGLVAVSGRKEATIPYLAPTAEPRLEYMVTQLIYKTIQKSKPKIGLMSPLPVMGETGSLPPQVRGGDEESWAFVQELEKQSTVVPVETDVKTLPDDLDMLIVIHPKDLSDDTLFALDQYVLKGGHLLAFVDPLSIAEQETSREQTPYGMPQNSSDLNTLTKAWGYTLTAGKVIADTKLASNVNLGPMGTQRLPTCLSLRSDEINRDEVSTSSLKILMLPFAGAFEGEPAEGLTMTELIHTSSDAKLVNSFMALQGGAQMMRNAEYKGKTPLAVRLQGLFTSAFPDGPPRDGESEDEEKKAMEGPFLKESKEEGVVVLVSDADMVYDNFAVRTMNFFGHKFNRPLNDNINFAVNLVETLAGSEALIGLRSRSTFDRPFDKVNELEQQAQERWQQEELKLQEKLQEMQQRINELQRTKEDGDQQFIMSPEQKREIEKFRKERFETQRQLKEVRKNLRREIERLGFRLKAINMALIPLLVIAFGLYHGWKRKEKAARR